MSRLSAIELTRWRAFEACQRIELRPLTLFFGWNNTGKSALLRALPLLADSARLDAVTPLNLKGPAARGATCRDVSWRGERKGLSLALEWAGDVAQRYEVLLMLDDDRPEHPRMRVERFSWHDGRAQVSGHWNGKDFNGRGMGFDVVGAWEGAATLRFAGLRPVSSDEEMIDRFLPLVRNIEALDGAVQWLASVRAVPGVPVRIEEGIPRVIEADGRDVLDVLQHEPGVLDRVNEWLETHANRSLELVNVSPGYVRPELRHAASNHAQRLADHGEGLRQVLPVLAAVERARHLSTSIQFGPRIIAAEDPESHLHPRLQRQLAWKLAEVAMDDDPPTMVLETHSQHLLLALQLAVAQGINGRRLDPARVAMYWVEQGGDGVSSAAPMSVDANGDLHGWPPDVYSDVVDMARELTTHRWGLRR